MLREMGILYSMQLTGRLEHERHRAWSPTPELNANCQARSGVGSGIVIPECCSLVDEAWNHEADGALARLLSVDSSRAGAGNDDRHGGRQ
jgi:hypothetical protein